MVKIAFFTTTRAEFGILSSFIKKVQNDPLFEVSIFVGGTHLKKEYGYTIEEIKSLNFNVTDVFDYIESLDDTNYSLAKASGNCILQVTELFEKYSFDYVCILGDRYELISIILPSILYKVPIIHFGGGESTEGVIDDKIRNMITQASLIHFTSAKEYTKKIIQSGVANDKVFTVGSPIIELIKDSKPIPKEELFNQLKLRVDKKVVLLTYHPVTIEQDVTPLLQIQNIFEALSKYDFQIVVTSPNMESDRAIIMNFINKVINDSQNIYYFDSLGVKKYHSLIPYCEFVIGNSSSGLFEVPFFKIPTINIGNRQKGRYLHDSVLQSSYDVESIVNCIERIKDPEFIRSIHLMKYKYGDGHSSTKALRDLKKIILKKNKTKY